MFADRDLRDRVTVRQIENYPDGLVDALEALDPKPVMYVGGIENHPRIIQLAQERHRLFGNDVQTVALTHDSEAVGEALGMAHVSFPEHRSANDPPEPDGSWILRPLNGCGGRGVTVWDSSQVDHPTLGEPHGFQKRVSGTSHSAVFIASESVGDIRFVGVTRQLIGESACHASGFQWCGNIGPVTLSVDVEHNVRRAGNVLKWKLGLRGIFGIDFIVDEDDVPWIIEVNPRYPASAELLEHVTGIPLLAEHCRCFDPDLDVVLEEPIEAPDKHYLCKAILYSPQRFTLTSELHVPGLVYAIPEISDVPVVGTTFQPGDPVCTVYAQGDTIDQAWDVLQRRLAEYEAKLIPSLPE